MADCDKQTVTNWLQSAHIAEYARVAGPPAGGYSALRSASSGSLAAGTVAEHALPERITPAGRWRQVFAPDLDELEAVAVGVVNSAVRTLRPRSLAALQR